MIENFPNFCSYENKYDNILDIEEYAEVPKALREYFSAIKPLVNKDELFAKMTEKQKDEIIFDLEDYILKRLYGKLFPSLSSELDSVIYQKCEELSELKPEKIIKNKKLIKESLLIEASKHFPLLNMGSSPKEKLDYMFKGLKIIYNLITLTIGTDISEQGSDEIYDPFYYSLINAKLKNLATNAQYIIMYLNMKIKERFYIRIALDFAGTVEVLREGLKLEE